MPDPADVRIGLIEAALSPAAGRGRQSVELVTSTAVRALCAELAALVGQRGVRALYERSVHLASLRYGWLSSLAMGRSDDLANDFQRTLAEHSADEVLEGGRALLVELTGLLAGLIGDTMTERIIRSAWNFHAQTGPSPENEQ